MKRGKSQFKGQGLKSTSLAFLCGFIVLLFMFKLFMDFIGSLN